MMTPLDALRAEYADALRAYLDHGDEAGLTHAYELGRRALTAGWGLLDMAALHQAAQQSIVLSAAPADRGRALDATALFFNELLAPFELSIEGYRAALSASEERFQLALSGATAGLWDWNPQTDAIFFSPYFKRIMGYEENELPNERAVLLAAIHADDLERVRHATTMHLEQRQPYDVEFRVRAKSGEFRWVQSRGQALWNAAGKAHRMVGWIVDITDRKRDEEALRRSREELRRLSAHIQQIREEEKARIARELHDDLGQQLTALKMAVSMSARDRDGEQGSPARAEKAIAAMIDELVDSVRRIAADLHPAILDDLGLIPAIEALLDEFMARYGIGVVRHIEDDSIQFNRPCRIELFRIIQEALTNVARHSGASEVAVDLVRTGAHCIVRVADNGRGIAYDVRQGRHSFGLLGMRERAVLLGGELRIQTAPGAGFTLTATIPLAAIEAKSEFT